MKQYRSGEAPRKNKQKQIIKKAARRILPLLLICVLFSGCGKGDGIHILPEHGSTANTAKAASDPGDDQTALVAADGFGHGTKTPAAAADTAADTETEKEERPSYNPEDSREEEDWSGGTADRDKKTSVSGNDSAKTGEQEEKKQENNTDTTDNDPTKNNENRNPDGSVNVDISKQTQTVRPDADTKTGTPIRLTTGSLAPNFTAELASGSSFKMSDYDQKIVILNFWTDRESACNTELSVLQKLQDDHIEDVEILCVNAAQAKDTVDRFINEHSYSVKMAYDETGKISDYYPADGYPYTLVIYKGIVKKTFVGVEDSLQKYRDYTTAIQECKNSGTSL